MISSDFRRIAREKLDKKWGKAVCIILAYMLVSFVISFVQGLLPETGFVAFIVSIAVYIIDIPLSFGLAFAFFKFFYGEDVRAFDFWNLGLSNISRAWGVAFRTLLKLLLPIGLLILGYVLTAGSIFMSSASILTGSSSGGSGFMMFVSFILIIVSLIWLVVKSYYYQLATCVAFDNPHLSPSDCVLKSEQLMINNRGKLFNLQLSFIGWAILAAFTFGIGYLWLLPYIQIANVAFYDALAHDGHTDPEVSN